ncbi:hypothetical protein L9F63_018778, partial [Diploptera punctata]
QTIYEYQELVERLHNSLRRFCIPVVFSTSPQSTAAMLPILLYFDALRPGIPARVLQENGKRTLF